MAHHSIGGTAVSGWLRLVRLPADLVTTVLPDGDDGPRDRARLVVDRLDASARDLLGAALRDAALREDARRRRDAVDERSSAMQLRFEAARRQREADAQLRARQDDAASRREEAERAAAQREDEIERERAGRRQRTEETATRQRTAIEHVNRERRESAAAKAKRERLEVLEREQEALDEEADALTAADEAKRLRNAAAEQKAARKQRQGSG